MVVVESSKTYTPSVVNTGRAVLKDVLEEGIGLTGSDSGIIIDYLLDNDYLSDKFFVEHLKKQMEKENK